MKRIIYPGWSVPLDLYRSYSPDCMLDFGFFDGEGSDSHYKVIGVDSVDMNDLSTQEILQDDPSILIAHSLGTLLALRSAQKFENIKAIVLIGGFAKFTQSQSDYPDGKPESGLAMMQNMMKLSPKMVLGKFYQAMVAPSDYSMPPHGKTDVARLKAGLQCLAETDLREDLKNINIPVLILHGDSDQIVSVELARFLKDNIAGAELHIFKNAGHALPFTHTEECLKIIDDFVLANS